MESDKRSLFGLQLGLREVASIVAVVAALVLWSVDRFQTKADAATSEDRTNRRIEKVEGKMDDLAKGVESVSRDTNYIRGRLEPQPK